METRNDQLEQMIIDMQKEMIEKLTELKYKLKNKIIGLNTKKAAEKKSAPKKEKKEAAPKTKRVWNGESYDIVKI